jgi:hypothetical protein
MKAKEYISLFNKTAKQFGAAPSDGCIRYNDKRKNHRRIKIVTFNPDHPQIHEAMANELKQQGIDAYTRTYKTWYTSYALIIKLPL